MKIYTKTGDLGETSLINGDRMSKSSEIFDLLGALDELNAHLGLASASRVSGVEKVITKIQKDLFSLGALLANPELKETDLDYIKHNTSDIEEIIDDLEKDLPKLNNFILPSGTKTAVNLHIARAVCRRLERTLVKCFLKKEIKGNSILKYINRLSDLLFVLARYVNYKLGVKEVIWKNNT